MTRVRTALAWIAGSTLCIAAHADPQTNRDLFSVSGFGTLGVAYSDNREADFVSTVFQPNGAGQSRPVSASVDSKIGLQVNSAMTERLTAVVQGIEEQRYDGKYIPTLEWANLSYKITSDWNVRVGRIVWPLYTRSQSVNVGYANLQIRNSAELEAEMPNTYSDGIDSTYDLQIGQTSSHTTLLYGHSRVNYPGNGSYLDDKDIGGISQVLEYHDLTLHATYMHMSYLFAYPGGSANWVKLPMYTVGAVYDDSHWYLSGDWMDAPDPYYGRMSAYAVLGGVHVSKFSPYVGYSRFTQATYGPGSAPLQTPSQGTTTVGVRWDIVAKWDLKVQYDHVQSGDVATVFPISYAFPNGVSAEFYRHPNSDVLSLVVDFIF